MLSLHDLAARLLPSSLQVETLTLEAQGLTLGVKVTAPTAPCPTCAQSATRMHSDYRRRSYWIPGSWHVRMMYTDGIPFHDPSQESDRAGQHHKSHRRGAVLADGS